MVLAELGTKITLALRKLNSQTIIDDKALNECLTEISIALLTADVNIKHVAKLKDSVNTQVKLLMQKEKGSNIRRLIQQTVISELTRMLDPEKKPVEFKKGEPNVVMFVGLQGSGKTTTCTKYAYYYQKRGWRVALVCADTFRAGAFDQLKMNAAKIKVPFYGSYPRQTP
jgi:signal recognition particle subunit SRP54